MTSRNMWRGATIAMLVAAVASCKGDDDGGTTGPTGSIQLAASPASLSVQQGTSGTVTVTLARGGGFTGTVALAIEGLPSGLAAASDPATLFGTTTSATITVTASAGVAPAAYTATVRATAPGVGDASATFAVNVTPAPNVTLAVTPAALTVAQGSSGAATVALTRTNFTGAVALTLDAPPAGITATFTPASVTDGSSNMAVSVAPGVAAGNYTLTIKGTATGIGDRTTTLALTVTPPQVSIALAVTPAAASVAQGGTGEATVTITRTNFADAVGLTTSAAPAGITFAFDQSPTTLNQARLTYTASASAPTGTFTITVTAQAAGVVSATATFSLQVTAAASSQVEFQFCSSSENPVFFAARDGAGAWQVVTATLSANVYRYRFALTQAVGGVFYVQQGGSAIIAGSALGTLETLARTGRLMSRALPDAVARLLPADALPQATTTTTYESTAYFATAAELASIGTDNCVATVSTKSVWLQVTGVGNGQEATLSLGGVTNVFDGDFGLSPVEFTGVRNGLIDFFGVRSSTLTGVPGKILDVRNLIPADGSTLPFTADFNSTSAYDPASAQLTIGNALGDDLLHFTTFHTANGDGGLLGGGFAPSTATTRTWYGLPPAKVVAGDVHANVIFASPAVTTADEQRYHFQFTTTVQNLSPVLGSRLPTQTVSPATSAGYRRIRVQGTLPAEYRDLVTVEYEPVGGGNEIWLIATGGYLAATGSATAYDLTTPDVGALPGFPVASAPAPGQWEVLVNVNGWSGSGTLNPVPANGVTLLGAAKEVKITMP